jgi:hypothetical protein
VGNVDADIAFDAGLLEFSAWQFGEDPTLGVAGTPFVEDGGYDSAMDSFEGEFHVAGQFSCSDRECLADVGGYVPKQGGSVDWIAVTTATDEGWRHVLSAKSASFTIALWEQPNGPLEALYSYGEKITILVESPIWEICSSCLIEWVSVGSFGWTGFGLGYLTQRCEE